MKLVKVRLKNFRCYKEEITIDFNNFTAVIGRNDVGKSAILDALDIFFENTKMDKHDASFDGNRDKVIIACTFSDVPANAVLDAVFPTTFSEEYLLNEDDHLEIVKLYNGSVATPVLKQTGALAMHPGAEGLKDLLELTITKLKARAIELGVNLEGVDQTKKAPIRAAIRNQAEDLNLSTMLVPLDKEDGKSIWGQIRSILPVFALFKSDRASTDQDSEAQDPLKAAIKAAVQEKAADLLELQEYVVTEVRKIANETVTKIAEMDPEIAATLNPIVTPKKWDSMFQTSITGDEGIPLNKRGSGIKRLVLLNFFRAKAEKDANNSDTNSIIYAVEEPETSQHPNYQRMLISSLNQISEIANNQVIITTHSPTLARTIPDNNLLYIQCDGGIARTITTGGEETNAEIAKTLGILPDHDVKLFIGIEGKHDITFLKQISKNLLADGLDVPDLEHLEENGEIIFFPLGGSNLALWTSRLKSLNRPEFYIFDRDHEPPLPPAYQAQMSEINSRANCSAVCTDKRELENYFHYSAINSTYSGMGVELNLNQHFSDYDDVPTILAKKIHDVSSTVPWGDLDIKVQKRKASGVKSTLNIHATKSMTRERLEEIGGLDEVRSWLSQIDQMINHE